METEAETINDSQIHTDDEIIDASDISQDVKDEINPWYSNQMVLWELASQLRYRYLSIRKPKPLAPGQKIRKFTLVRYLLGWKPELIISSVEKYGGFKNGNKYYFDLATWTNEMPMFSYEPSQRNSQKIDFDNNWQKFYVTYDFAIDLDALDKNPMTAHAEAALIKQLFDTNKIPYSVRFSGSKGFHFLIPAQYLPKRVKPMNLPRKCHDVAEWLIMRFNLKNVDATIYDHRRILKLAYSCDGNKVCLPLDDIQFKNFKVEDMTIQNVLRNVKIFKRGTLLRTHGLPEKQLCANVQKLFNGSADL